MVDRAVRWIMIVSGLLTCTMLYAVVAPHQVLLSNFGTTYTGPSVEVVARNWGALVVLSGLFVIYAASRPRLRAPALVIAGAGKLVFVALVLIYARDLLDGPLRVPVAVDTAIVVLYALCLAAIRRTA